MQNKKLISESPNLFKKRLSLSIKDEFLLTRALTHRSFLNENKGALEDNERLEFLGDAVLDFLVAEWLYHNYPEKPEGYLTKVRAAVVQTEQLSNFAKKIDLGNALRLGKGEIIAGGRERTAILCDAFEALIAAIYLDSGIDAVKNFLYPLLREHFLRISINQIDEDPKSALQEWAQSQGFLSPTYELVSETGPDHAKHFFMSVTINGEKWGEGSGSSKQSAEKEAAIQVLRKLKLME